MRTRPPGHLSIAELAHRLQRDNEQTRAYVWQMAANHPDIDPPLVIRRPGRRRDGKTTTWLWINEAQAYALFPELQRRPDRNDLARLERRIDSLQLLAERNARTIGEYVKLLHGLAGKPGG